MEFTLGIACFLTSIGGIATYVLGIFAEIKRMPPPMPVLLKHGKMKCNYPEDHSIYFGYLAILFTVLSSVVGSMYKYHRAGGVRVPADAYQHNSMLKVFYCWAMFMEGLALYMMIKPLYTMRQLGNMTYEQAIVKCPSPDRGLVAGGALSAFGAALLWIVVFVFARNCRLDFLRGDDGNSSVGSYGLIDDEVGADW
uniref:Uncharacterized protein n=1 Tax=Kalanchoe fedtschenkoi TaxID=63787 RepID=A0A7N0UAJ8_KALFE